MFEFLSFELIVHDSAGGVVFRGAPGIITVIIGAVPALCENAPYGKVLYNAQVRKVQQSRPGCGVSPGMQLRETCAF